jgi:hypothetical protein
LRTLRAIVANWAAGALWALWALWASIFTLRPLRSLIALWALRAIVACWALWALCASTYASTIKPKIFHRLLLLLRGQCLWAVVAHKSCITLRQAGGGFGVLGRVTFTVSCAHFS